MVSLNKPCKHTRVCLLYCHNFFSFYLIPLFFFSFLTLFERDPELGNIILANPDFVLPHCDSAIIAAQEDILEENTIESDCKLSIKTRIHARISGI